MGVPAAAMAAMAGGSILGAMGTLAQGKAAEQEAKFNAQMAEVEGRQREASVRRRGRRQMGSIRAAIGKSGVTSEGSPMEVLAESAAAIEMDAVNARLNAQMTADTLRARGKAARKASKIGAAAQLLQGAASTAGTGAQLGAFG